jgi:hypothetical protein
MSATNGDSDHLPRDARTGKAISSKMQPGYYPGYSTLGQQNFWDAATRTVVLDRVYNVPPIRFFTPEEAHLMESICEHIIPQSDRDDSRRIPILPVIDKRLFDDTHDGYRFEKMPPDREAFRLGLRAIDEMSQLQHGLPFVEIGALEQDQLLRSLQQAKPRGADETWKRMPPERFWMLIVQDCIEAYYAHPWAWDEIGYGGPAYPRAYTRLENGLPEPWERDEERYEWDAPADSVSDEYEPIAGQAEHHGTPGQEGTH